MFKFILNVNLLCCGGISKVSIIKYSVEFNIRVIRPLHSSEIFLDKYSDIPYLNLDQKRGGRGRVNLLLIR